MKKFILVLLAATVIGACVGTGDQRRLADLDELIIQYAQALRWGRFTDARDFHLTRDGERPEVDLGKLEDIRVTGFDVHDKTVSDDFSEVTVVGTLNYYTTTYGTLNSIPLEQKWWFEPESERWLLESAFPEFK